MIRLVLFDIDGTLLLTGGAGEKAFAKVCETVFGIPEGTRGLTFAGRTDRSIVRDFFRAHGIAAHEQNFREFFDAYIFWLDHLLYQCVGRVLPGVLELLAALRQLPARPFIGLLTGNIRLGAEVKLRHYGLWQWFETGAFGDDDEDRNQLACIARERGSKLAGCTLRGEEILVIGDTPLDIACARMIQARALAVATGIFRLSDLTAHAPHWALEDLRGAVAAELCA
jgi:phosphoglycolate phosphatase-like HAD superfamily hydrolase